ncbi:hypothetical protein KDU71_21725 [Carboxylicivirga sediminis]|uniref:DUF4369 domain-containing protein n=1 Tax=Carboxylicivirga sediminis TaxID=2006564 RepID=A0A941F7E8_9BACT|nr:DUF6599 family protein [Carboxylicivirga sediminis]MBR8538206.1 hypothetical protein [Carboxylicivirga sediminis]
MTRLFIIASFIISATFCHAQIKVTFEQTYDAGALYGYMNGGSELYKEYQFQKLTVQELEVDGQELKFECFEMASPSLAFGIFSVNVYQCHSAENNLLPHLCATDYQLQAVYGNRYLSIINNTGSSDAQKAAEKVLHSFMENTPENHDPLLPKYITQLNPDNIMYMNGMLAMENRAAQWTGLYQQLELNSCYILKWKTSKVSVMVFQADKKSISDLADENYLVKQKKGAAYVAPKGYDDAFINQLFKTL